MVQLALQEAMVETEEREVQEAMEEITTVALGAVVV